MDIKIRPANSDDVQKIWKIRNEPTALAVAASKEVIPLARHVAWFNGKYFSNSGSVCFIAEIDRKVVGYSRFDLKKDHYVNSIAVASSMHGKGIGAWLLRESIEQLKSPIPIHAEIRKFNTASIKMFERAGFKKISEDEQNIYYQL